MMVYFDCKGFFGNSFDAFNGQTTTSILVLSLLELIFLEWELEIIFTDYNSVKIVLWTNLHLRNEQARRASEESSSHVFTLEGFITF